MVPPLTAGANNEVAGCVLYKKWNDFQLSWNPGDYGNVNKTRVPISKLWSPDVTVINRSTHHACLTSIVLRVHLDCLQTRSLEQKTASTALAQIGNF